MGLRLKLEGVNGGHGEIQPLLRFFAKAEIEAVLVSTKHAMNGLSSSSFRPETSPDSVKGFPQRRSSEMGLASF